MSLTAVGDTAGQSFTPTASQMNTVVFDVDVETHAADPIGKFAMTVAAQLLAGDGLGGSVLAQSADVQIASGQQNAGPHVFTFPTTVALTPGTKYTVALTVRSVQGAFTYIDLQAQGSDVYGGGQGYSSTGPVGTLDFYFQEGITYPASVTAVHAFSGTDGANPFYAPIVGNDGNLYGTTAEVYSGGSGTVYMLSPDGATFTTLHTFDGADGAGPEGGLLQASDGFLYGTTVNRGPNGGGTVFKISTDGTMFATLHAFGGGVFGGPYFGLIQADDGFLYGTASADGAFGDGTVFAVSTDGTTFRTVHSFSGGDGADPSCTLVEGLDGNLYGTTISGGTNDDGVVFMVSRDGQTFKTLHSFDGSDGLYPGGWIAPGQRRQPLRHHHRGRQCERRRHGVHGFHRRDDLQGSAHLRQQRRRAWPRRRIAPGQRRQPLRHRRRRRRGQRRHGVHDFARRQDVQHLVLLRRQRRRDLTIRRAGPGGRRQSLRRGHVWRQQQR